MPRSTLLKTLAPAVLLLVACGTPDDVDPDPHDPNEISYSTHIEPILAEHCVPCHTEDGAGGFPLDSLQSATDFGNGALNAMETGRMPPWQPDPDCRPLRDERIIAESEIDLFREWLHGDMAPGPEAEPTPPIVTTFEPTHTATIPEPYTPVLGEADDYRCFILDLEFPEELYLRGATVIPGNGLVHHVIVYALSAGQADEARTRDADEEGPGYTCFGAPVQLGQRDGELSGFQAVGELLRSARFPTQLGAWVPGHQPTLSPDGVAMRVEAGSIVVMQVHYSALAGQAVADATTEFQAILTDEEPEYLARTTPLAQLTLDIPAGESAVEAQETVPYYGERPLEIVGVVAHMHLLGTQIGASVIRQDGAEECGLDIPDWDFNWQQAYRFEEGAEFTVANGDAVRVSCTYDNTAGNQPVVNGEQLEPRDVEWGDGTLDEMCLLYLSTVEPFSASTPADAPSCSSACADSCGTDLACLADCAGNNLGCFGCILAETFECGATGCAVELIAAQECLRPCALNSLMLTGSFGLCMSESCAGLYGPAAECLSEVLAADDCAGARTACGLD